MDADDVYDPNAEVLGELGAFSPDYDPRGITLVRNSLPVEETVFDAARRGDVAHLRRLVEVQGEAVNQYDTFDASPLYYAALCGHTNACEYLLEKGARCQPDTWDGERCHYAALSDSIRALLRRFEAVNRQRGPLFTFTFRAFNNPAAHADVLLVLPHDGGATLHAHRAVLSRAPFFRRRFGRGGRWEARSEVRLTDPRLRAAPLRAVIGFLYTERLLCAGGDVPAVLAIAENLRLHPLAAYLRSLTRRVPLHPRPHPPARAEEEAGQSGEGPLAAALPPPDVPDLALDLGLPYAIGALPDEEGEEEGEEAEAEGAAAVSAEPALLAAARASGLRSYLRAHVLPGVVPPGLLPEAWDGAGLCEGGEGEGEGGPAGGAEQVPPPPFHDLELCVGGRVFRAHRLFVCGRSRFVDSALRFEAQRLWGDTGVARLSLEDVSAPVFGVLLEWVYLDALRPHLPLWAVAEALVASDVLALADGLRPLLVQQACGHVSPASVVGLLRLADLLGLHRLTAACARCVARHLDATLADPDFRSLIAENAAGIARREAVDSVPMLDEVRSELRRLRAAACGGSGARVYAAGGVVEHAEAHAEFDRRFGALQAFEASLGIRARDVSLLVAPDPGGGGVSASGPLLPRT